MALEYRTILRSAAMYAKRHLQRLGGNRFRFYSGCAILLCALRYSSAKVAKARHAGSQAMSLRSTEYRKLNRVLPPRLFLAGAWTTAIFTVVLRTRENLVCSTFIARSWHK